MRELAPSARGGQDAATRNLIPNIMRFTVHLQRCDFRCDARPAGSSSSGRQSCDNNGGVGGDSAAAMLQAAAMPTPKDAEEYYCLRQPDPDETGSSLRSSPDVVAQKGPCASVRRKMRVRFRGRVCSLWNIRTLRSRNLSLTLFLS